MSEGMIAVCIFSVVVLSLTIFFVWLGERQDKKEQEKNGKEKDGEKPVDSNEKKDSGGARARFVRLEGLGRRTAKSSRRGDDRRAGIKACKKNNGADVDGGRA